MSDEGAVKFGKCLSSSQLVQLDLTGNKIGDDGARGLAQASNRKTFLNFYTFLIM